MSKKGMKRPQVTHTEKRNEYPPVPELQGKQKHHDCKANPIIEPSDISSEKVFHTKPHKTERPISKVYSQIDNDLARDNLENDIPSADLNDLS